jgi:prevent-host-death family protein
MSAPAPLTVPFLITFVADKSLCLHRPSHYYTSMDTAHGHEESRIPAGEFKQRCLALLDRVAESGVPIVVTKRGRPVARLVPIDVPAETLIGSIRVLAELDEELYSTGDAWDAEHGE